MSLTAVCCMQGALVHTSRSCNSTIRWAVAAAAMHRHQPPHPSSHLPPPHHSHKTLLSLRPPTPGRVLHPHLTCCFDAQLHSVWYRTSIVKRLHSICCLTSIISPHCIGPSVLAWCCYVTKLSPRQNFNTSLP